MRLYLTFKYQIINLDVSREDHWIYVNILQTDLTSPWSSGGKSYKVAASVYYINYIQLLLHWCTKKRGGIDFMGAFASFELYLPV